jgi:hypothetical protein
MWDREEHAGIWWEKLKARYHSENPDVDERGVLK